MDDCVEVRFGRKQESAFSLRVNCLTCIYVLVPTSRRIRTEALHRETGHRVLRLLPGLAIPEESRVAVHLDDPTITSSGLLVHGAAVPLDLVVRPDDAESSLAVHVRAADTDQVLLKVVGDLQFNISAVMVGAFQCWTTRGVLARSHF